MSISVGYRNQPLNHAPVSGDGWLMLAHAGGQRLLFSDGIGHGPKAQAIVQRLHQQLRWIQQRSEPALSLLGCLAELHQSLLGQGPDAQAAVALIDIAANHMEISGVCIGNIRVHLISTAGCSSLPSLNGMVGGRMPSQPQSTTLRAQSEGWLLLHSDGVAGPPALRMLQAALARPVALRPTAQSLAQELVEACAQQSDDASCAVLQLRSQA